MFQVIPCKSIALTHLALRTKTTTWKHKSQKGKFTNQWESVERSTKKLTQGQDGEAPDQDR